jgi:alpha-galactosidase-like protein
VTITPAWTNSTNAGVTVAFDPVPCVKAAPTVAASPSQSQWVNPGTAVTFTVTTTNHDGSGCAASTFNVAATVPSGWSVTYGATPVTIAPGASASSTARVTSPLTATGGFYTIGLKTTDVASATRTASTSATYVVTAPLSVSVTTNQATYTRGTQATITTTVRANGAAVAGAAVTLTVTRADGSTTSQSATTGSNGNAIVTYQIKHRDPVGTYRISSRASVSGGAVTGVGSATFTVTGTSTGALKQ